MRTGSLALACTLALAAPGLAPGQDEVRITLAREPGTVWVYRLRVETTLVQDGERSEVLHEARIALRAGDERRAGLDIVEARILDLSLHIEQGADAYDLRATREADAVAIDAAQAPDELGAIVRAVVEAPIRLGLAPSGEIMGLQGLAPAAALADDAGVLGASALGVFYPETLAGALEPIFHADDAGDEPRAPGDTWATTARRPLGEGRTIVETLRCTLSTGPGWTGELTVAVEHDDALPATTSRVAITGHSGAVVAQWDARASALASRTRTLATDLAWRLGDLEITQRQETTITLERIEPDAPLPDSLFTPPDA